MHWKEKKWRHYIFQSRAENESEKLVASIPLIMFSCFFKRYKVTSPSAAKKCLTTKEYYKEPYPTPYYRNTISPYFLSPPTTHPLQLLPKWELLQIKGMAPENITEKKEKRKVNSRLHPSVRPHRWHSKWRHWRHSHAHTPHARGWRRCITPSHAWHRRRR